jgi:hypothetical protein
MGTLIATYAAALAGMIGYAAWFIVATWRHLQRLEELQKLAGSEPDDFRAVTKVA